MTPRSWLFAPGDTPAKMGKACASAADAVILDLEDSVAEAMKPDARRLTAQFLETAVARTPTLWVRINPLSTGLTLDDLAAVVRPGLAGVILPKSGGVADVVRGGGRS